MTPNWRVAARALLRAGVVAAPAMLAGCLPIPHRETETFAVTGQLLAAGRPVANRRVSVEQPEYVGPGQPAACSGAASVVTNQDGIFTTPRRRRWRLCASLIGESPEWHMPIRLCAQGPDSVWRPLHLLHRNGRDPDLRLICDIARPVQRDTLTGEVGVCTRIESPYVTTV